MVRRNLNALHAVRKSFIEVELSEKFWRALRSNIRNYADEELVTGVTVYYRRQNYKEWHTSAKGLGKEGQCVLIRYGGTFYRMYPCHLMKANKEFGSLRKEENNFWD